MNWLNRLPGFQRTPPGHEWALWKRLPAILAWGTAIPLAFALALWWIASATPALAGASGLMVWAYQLLGLVVLHWTVVFTVAIGCVVVMVMKGPAYVADAYPPPDRS